MPSPGNDWFDDPREVERDDELIEQLRDGQPITNTEVGRLLAAWRDDMHRAIDSYFDDILARLTAERAPAAQSTTALEPVQPPVLDAQSRAYRENTIHVTDEQVLQLAERVHQPASSLAGILLPEDWEALRWDMGRAEPKTVDEARDALAARIADPSAPDDETHAGAYDNIQDGPCG